MAEASGAIPSLLTRDLKATLGFYESLGFAITGRAHFEGGEWAEVTRDGAVLQFYTDPPAGTPDRPMMSGTIYFRPPDLEALAREWRDRVEFEWGPEQTDYGIREFAIRDPNGYLIAFSEPADPA